MKSLIKGFLCWGILSVLIFSFMGVAKKVQKSDRSLAEKVHTLLGINYQELYEGAENEQ